MKKRLLNSLREKGLKIATAESCTGGLLAKRITDISGASDVFECGVICYSNEVKNKVLGVPTEILEKYGAVSEQVAKALAKGVCDFAHSDIGIGITGIAGPTGATENKPVGLIYFSVYSAKSDSFYNAELKLDGTRKQNRSKTVDLVFEAVEKLI